jgi:pyruvate dehydrogenase E1 component alpha subunit
MYAAVEEAAERARSGGGPTYIEAMTYRLWGHMMGDPEIYRTKDEVAKAREVEPIARLCQRLKQLGYSDADLSKLEEEAEAIIADALRFAETSPAPSLETIYTDVFA